MKGEVAIVFLCSVFVLLVGFGLFNSDGFSFTGQVVLNDSEAEAFLEGESVSNVSRAEVMVAFDDGADIIDEMSENGFSIIYMNDSLIVSRRILQQVDYAEMLRGNLDGSNSDKIKARAALALIDWKSLEYGDVMVYLEDISDRREKAFEIYDSIVIIRKSLERYADIDVSEAGVFLDNASVAFYEDKYDDAEDFLDNARASLDEKSSEISVLGGLKRGLINFVQMYWIYILIFLILIGIGLLLSYKKFNKHFLMRRIFKKKAEEGVLIDLMKKAQTERFKENKISGLVYNIRMKKYEEKLGEIKRILPVLEDRLRRMG